jgi:hypothetical protein
LKRLSFLIVIIIIFLASCTSYAKPITEYVNQNMVTSNKNTEKIDKYDSPYTMCYKNSDGTYTIYMFASPISFKNSQGRYEYIDNNIIKNPDADMLNKGYDYRNAKNSILTYFPQKDNNDIIVKNGDDIINFSLVKPDSTSIASAKLENSKNMYGDSFPEVTYGINSDAIQIKNYVTKAGVKSEVVLNKYPGTNEIKFKVKISGYTPENNSNGYIRFLDSKKNMGGIIYSGIQKDSYTKSYTEKDGHLSINSSVDIEPAGSPDIYIVTFTLDNKFLKNKNTVYPVKFDPSFEFYLNKQPDSGVYSKNPYTNAYLSPISVIGNSDFLGIGRQYIRFRYDYFFRCDANSVISSFYHLREFTGFSSDEKVSFDKMNEQWSSTGLNWNNKIDFGNEITSKIVNKSGDISFDITKFTKDCFADPNWMTESYGLLLKGSEQNDRYRVIASSDNSEYPPYVEINLKSLPQEFTFREDINPLN